MSFSLQKFQNSWVSYIATVFQERKKKKGRRRRKKRRRKKKKRKRKKRRGGEALDTVEFKLQLLEFYYNNYWLNKVQLVKKNNLISWSSDVKNSYLLLIFHVTTSDLSQPPRV